MIIVPFICGSLVTLGAGGASLTRRVGAGAVCGVLIGILSTVSSTILGANTTAEPGDLIANGLWRIFLFTLMSTIGVLVTEFRLPEPKDS